MMTHHKRQRLILIGALVAAAAAVAVISIGGIEKNLVYYLDAEELLAKGQAAHGATVRLGGVVQDKSVVFDSNTLALRFKLGNDEKKPPAIVVVAQGTPPQMFQEGMGAIVEGRFNGTSFYAERVMVKHSNEYRPPAPGERPKDLYKTLQAPLDTGLPPQEEIDQARLRHGQTVDAKNATVFD